MVGHTVLDIARWSRADAFHFFRHFDDPFFNVCAEIEVTALVRFCQVQKEASFFLRFLFCTHQVVNEIEAFRYRIVGEEVFIYEEVLAGSTVLRPDKSFCFAYFTNHKLVADFETAGKLIIKETISKTSFTDRDNELYMVHYSSLPWISFTGIKHPRNFQTNDSVPKIVFGQYHKKDGKYFMSVSVDVHHALMDGYDVGLFFKSLQKKIVSLNSV